MSKLYALQHQSRTFGVVALDEPLDIVQLSALYHRAKAEQKYGKIRLHNIQSETKPEEHIIVIFPESRSISRRDFEILVTRLLADKRITTEWTTRPDTLQALYGHIIMYLMELDD